MVMSLSQRRAKLAKTPMPTVYEPPQRFRFVALSLVAYHLGGWRPDGKESIRAAYTCVQAFTPSSSPARLNSSIRRFTTRIALLPYQARHARSYMKAASSLLKYKTPENSNVS
jgi:hypothetical protein